MPETWELDRYNRSEFTVRWIKKQPWSSRVARVKYIHAYHGCSSGCCGHEVILLDKNDEPIGATGWGLGEHDKENMDQWAGEIAAGLGVPVGPNEFLDD